MAVGHPHRGPRPELQGADGGVAFRIPGRCGRTGRDPLHGRGAGGAAASLGAGRHPDSAQDPAAPATGSVAALHQGGGRHPPLWAHGPSAHAHARHAALPVGGREACVGARGLSGPGSRDVPGGDGALRGVLLERRAAERAPERGPCGQRGAHVGVGRRPLRPRDPRGAAGPAPERRSVPTHTQTRTGRALGLRTASAGGRSHGQDGHGGAHGHVRRTRRDARVLGVDPVHTVVPLGVRRAFATGAPRAVGAAGRGPSTDWRLPRSTAPAREARAEGAAIRAGARFPSRGKPRNRSIRETRDPS